MSAYFNDEDVKVIKEIRELSVEIKEEYPNLSKILMNLSYPLEEAFQALSDHYEGKKVIKDTYAFEQKVIMELRKAVDIPMVSPVEDVEGYLEEVMEKIVSVEG